MCPWVAQLVKESARNVEDRGSIPGSGRPSGGGHGNPLQCSCLENPHGERGWRAAVHGVAELDTPERASTSIFRGDVALEELHGHGMKTGHFLYLLPSGSHATSALLGPTFP